MQPRVGRLCIAKTVRSICVPTVLKHTARPEIHVSTRSYIEWLICDSYGYNVRIGDQFKSPCFCSYGLYSSPPHFTSLTRISYYILLFIPAEKTRGEPIRAEPLSAVPRRWSVPKPKRTEPKKSRIEPSRHLPNQNEEPKRNEPSRAEPKRTDPIRAELNRAPTQPHARLLVKQWPQGKTESVQGALNNKAILDLLTVFLLLNLIYIFLF